jgi:hypothetical protein
LIEVVYMTEHFMEKYTIIRVDIANIRHFCGGHEVSLQYGPIFRFLLQINPWLGGGGEHKEKITSVFPGGPEKFLCQAVLLARFEDNNM